MSALLVRLDDSAIKQLETLSRSEGIRAEEFAAKLLRRAILQTRARRKFDAQEIASANSSFAAEDLALTESDAEARLQALCEEDGK